MGKLGNHSGPNVGRLLRSTLDADIDSVFQLRSLVRKSLLHLNEAVLATAGHLEGSGRLIKIWREVVVESGRRYQEVTLQVGDTIRVGDAVISIVETQDNQAAVLVEELNLVDDFSSGASLPT